MATKRRKGADETLTSALARLLEKTILPDLADRAKSPAVAAVLRAQHAHEQQSRRTADPFEAWLPRWLEQIGAAWILSCVFLRTLEDRGLVRHRRVAGEGAADAEQLFFELALDLRPRDYLLTAFREVARLPGAEALLGPAHNPAFRLSPSNEGAEALLAFFREAGKGGKGLRWHFEGSDTTFLGDLYQHLSESVRERYALLQTPPFVLKFILDLTLEPAIQTFGLEETHVLDPTCGSGHFLLGAFERLCEHRMRAAPGVDAKVHALAALGQVHGVDLNPYAAAIARFRLTLAYLEKAGLRGLWDVPRRLPIDVVVADSLLHGAAGATGWLAGMQPPMFELEDPEAAEGVFKRRYQAVVGNPPYITCKDTALREAYRERYPKSASGKYALAAPFTERFFQLGVEGGYVGLINANSFMKREFGKKLIEEVLKHLDLTRVIDTSGAYIPGHGTPTVLLFGRNQRPVRTTVRAVLGKKGEPETPEAAENGKVWSAIAAHFDEVPFEDGYISTADMQRETLHKHPWSLGGGGAAGLKETLEARGVAKLGDRAEDIGFASFTGLDEAFIVPGHLASRVGPAHILRPMVTGESIRDWTCTPLEVAITPYETLTQEPLELATEEPWARFVWRFRSCTENVTSFGNRTRKQCGDNWWEWYRWQAERYRAPFRLPFAFVATHNHFVLDRGGKVFKQSAPIIKLKEDTTEEDHLALLAYLNSSAACFWMKQIFHDKGSGTDTGKWQAEPAKIAYEFAGTGLNSLPVPDVATKKQQFADLASGLEALANRRVQLVDEVIAGLHGDGSALAFQERIRKTAEQDADMLARSIYLQECIDWQIYASLGLAPGSLALRLMQNVASGVLIPLGARPFELRLARAGQEAGIDGQKLHRHLPDDCLADVLLLWEDLIGAIDQSPELGIIETPDYKRRWSITPKDTGGRVITFEDRVRDRLQAWLADRIEAKVRASEAPLSLRRLVDQLSQDTPFSIAAEHWSGATDIRPVVEEFIRADAIPYLAALRYTDAGMDIRARWERTWALQRREDAGETLPAPIVVPDKYDAKDYRDPSYYRIRGKLDVPKERFISYPGAEKEDDRSPLFGWAGWNHLERALAIATLYQHRKTEEGWTADRLTPLLAGILELVPWIKQWHNDMNEEYGERLGDYYERYVEGEAHALGLTLDALRAWRPHAAARKGRSKKGPA